MKHLLLLVPLLWFTSVDASSALDPTADPICQEVGACKGDVFTFSVPSGSNFSWTVFQGASIISGQGTNRIRVQSPTNSGFLIRLTYNDGSGLTTVFDLAEFSAHCP